MEERANVEREKYRYQVVEIGMYGTRYGKGIEQRHVSWYIDRANAERENVSQVHEKLDVPSE